MTGFDSACLKRDGPYCVTSLRISSPAGFKTPVPTLAAVTVGAAKAAKLPVTAAPAVPRAACVAPPCASAGDSYRGRKYPPRAAGLGWFPVIGLNACSDGVSSRGAAGGFWPSARAIAASNTPPGWFCVVPGMAGCGLSIFVSAKESNMPNLSVNESLEAGSMKLLVNCWWRQ